MVVETVVVEDPFQTSLSAFSTYQNCPQQYYYQYVRRLSLKGGKAPQTLGIVLHDYLEAFYSYLIKERDAVAAHQNALLVISSKWIGKIRELANVARSVGDFKTADAFSRMPRDVKGMADRYFEYRGRNDANKYEFIRAEDWLRFGLTAEIISVGKVDLVTRDLTNGHVNIWEHKSTQTIPPDGVRLRDFQTVLYIIQLEQIFGIYIDTIIWNYIWTKVPEPPEVVYKGTKREGLSRKEAPMTWPIFAEAIRKHGYALSDYDDMYEKLKDREETNFFPRYEVMSVTSRDKMMTNYINGSERMRRERIRWESGVDVPLRNLSRSCEYCDFKRLCNAALVDGDEEDLIPMYYNVRPEYKGTNG